MKKTKALEEDMKKYKRVNVSFMNLCEYTSYRKPIYCLKDECEFRSINVEFQVNKK